MVVLSTLVFFETVLTKLTISLASDGLKIFPPLIATTSSRRVFMPTAWYSVS